MIRPHYSVYQANGCCCDSQNAKACFHEKIYKLEAANKPKFQVNSKTSPTFGTINLASKW
jgi:hypothetical protein